MSIDSIKQSTVRVRTVTEEQHKNLVTLYNWLKEDKDVPDEIYHYHKSLCLFTVIKAMKMKKYSEGDRNILNYTIEEYNKTHGDTKIKTINNLQKNISNFKP